MFALTLKGGTAQSTAPDTCNTPSPAGPVPTPYVNIFQCNMVDPSTACQKVMIDGSPALNVKSQTLISNGDEAGNSPGGVVSGKFIGKGEFIMGSQKVQLESKAAVSQGVQTKHNEGNTVVMCSMSGQSKVQIS